MKYLLILAFLVAGCSDVKQYRERVKRSIRNSKNHEYEMNCHVAHHNITRCENNEVICYSAAQYKSGGGIHCTFKGGQ